MKFKIRPRGGEIVVVDVDEEFTFAQPKGTIGRIKRIERDRYPSEEPIYMCYIEGAYKGEFMYYLDQLRPATGGEKNLFRMAEKKGYSVINSAYMKSNLSSPKSV